MLSALYTTLNFGKLSWETVATFSKKNQRSKRSPEVELKQNDLDICKIVKVGLVKNLHEPVGFSLLWKCVNMPITLFFHTKAVSSLNKQINFPCHSCHSWAQESIYREKTGYQSSCNDKRRVDVRSSSMQRRFIN